MPKTIEYKKKKKKKNRAQNNRIKLCKQKYIQVRLKLAVFASACLY